MQLIIPARNEELRLPATLRALREYAMSPSENLEPIEIIVVDNASTDRTAAVARAESSAGMPVRVVPCATPGKGAAVRAGVAASVAKVIGYLDADGATALDSIATAGQLLAHSADVAVGSRAMPGSTTTARHTRVRTLGAFVYRSLAGRLVPDIRDTQCGFKLMDGDLARRIFADTVADGFSFDVEVLGRARLAGARIVEFPVAWTDMPGSTFIPARDGLAAFRELAAIGSSLRAERRVPRPREFPLEPVTTLLPAPSALGHAIDQ